jgi:hypothetical protein
LVCCVWVHEALRQCPIHPEITDKKRRRAVNDDRPARPS